MLYMLRPNSQQHDTDKDTTATVFAMTQTVCGLYLFNFCPVSEQI